MRHRSSARAQAVAIALVLLAGTESVAGLGEEQRWLELPDSIYMSLSDDLVLDRDADGLKDDYENRLADAWRPYFVFDEGENAREKCGDVAKVVDTVVSIPCSVIGVIPVLGEGCTKVVQETVTETVCKQNIDDDSLRPNEPVVIFQVRSLAGESWPRRLEIQWVFLFRLDGGYRGSNVCTNYHYGDTQSGSYEVLSHDGVRWSIDTLDLWSHEGKVPATSPKISWTPPRGTYWGKLPDRPSPMIYASAGKHHQYISAQACEDEPGTCDDDCGGGQERGANLTPQGAFTNVGEFQAHPGDQGTNVPFVSDLGPIGFPGEQVWFATSSCHCALETTSVECFTGGMGSDWDASVPHQGCDQPTPVHDLLNLAPPPRNPMELGTLYTVVLLF